MKQMKICFINYGKQDTAIMKMYYGQGYEPGEMKHCKVFELMDVNISGPTVIL